MAFKLSSVERNLLAAGMFDVGQFPLPRRLRYFPTDIAVDRVTGEDDFSAAQILQNRSQGTWIMVIEKPKTAKTLGLAFDCINQTNWIRFSHIAGHTKDIIYVWIANKVWIKRLSVAGQPVKTINICF